jgi:hypothetical protein
VLALLLHLLPRRPRPRPPCASGLLAPASTSIARLCWSHSGDYARPIRGQRSLTGSGARVAILVRLAAGFLLAAFQMRLQRARVSCGRCSLGGISIPCGGRRIRCLYFLTCCFCCWVGVLLLPAAELVNDVHFEIGKVIRRRADLNKYVGSKVRAGLTAVDRFGTGDAAGWRLPVQHFRELGASASYLQLARQSVMDLHQLCA